MTVEKKTVDGPIQDYDNDSYDEVVQILEVREETFTESIDLASAKPKDLLVYFANRFKEVHGYEYVVSWEKEMAVMKAYKERYAESAGPMIALLFDKYGGEINGGIMTVTAFSKGSKWIQDKLYIELNRDKIKEAEPKPNVEGLMDSSDFLKRIAI